MLEKTTKLRIQRIVVLYIEYTDFNMDFKNLRVYEITNLPQTTKVSIHEYK